MLTKKSFETDTKVKLSVVADEAFMTKTKDHVLRHLARDVKVPGFRPGTAPQALVEKQVSSEVLQSEFLDEAVNRLYTEAVRIEKLRPVANPTVNLKKFVPYTQFEFDAEVEVIGEISLANYKTIKVSRQPVVVTNEDIEGVIKTLQKRLATKKVVDRATKDGDEVIIDFEGKDEKGEAVGGAEAKEYPLVIGSNSFIPGFEPNLVGLKAGEEKTFDVVFPKDYQVKSLINKKVTFSVKVHSVTELELPKVDDNFAAQAGPIKTVKDLKEDIRRQLTYEQEVEAQKAYENELIQAISEKTKVAIPDVLIDDQVKRAEDEERRNLVYRGQTWQEHLKEDGVTEEEHRQRNRPSAEATIKASLVLSEIAELENITITPEEVDIRVQLLKGQYQDKAMQAELDKPENRRDIEARLMADKTFEKLASYAKH